MTGQARKDAIRAFKERTPSRGVFAMRCASTGQAWVGSTLNLEAARNAVWFSLRANAHRDKALQAAWAAHGDEGLHFEIVETLPGDTAALVVGDALKSMKREWIARLRAVELLP